MCKANGLWISFHMGSTVASPLDEKIVPVFGCRFSSVLLRTSFPLGSLLLVPGSACSNIRTGHRVGTRTRALYRRLSICSTIRRTASSFLHLFLDSSSFFARNRSMNSWLGHSIFWSISRPIRLLFSRLHFCGHFPTTRWMAIPGVAQRFLSRTFSLFYSSTPGGIGADPGVNQQGGLDFS